MAYALGVLFLVAGLLLAVALHELGHLVPAKAFGVKVPRYFVGFGPTLWSTRGGETEYGIKAIPLGGFVSIAGMYLPRPRRGRDRPGRGGRPSIIEEAREYASEELGPGERHRAFHALSVPKKLAVMFGGPFVNLVLCFLLLAVVLVGVGRPVATTTLAAVSPCLPPASAQGAAAPGGATPDPATCEPSPAAAAGLQAGDTILTWDGARVSTWDELQGAISDGGTGTVTVGLVRDGATLTVTVTPVEVPRPVVGSDGAVETDAAGEPVLVPRPFVGVGAASEMQPQPLSAVPGAFWQQVTGTFGVILQLPQYLAGAVGSIFSGAERSDGVMSVVGVGMVAGEIASVEAPEYTLTLRLADLTSVLASLNMALFAFNMIPLLPLDGGHIVGALWEGLRRTVARLRGRPDPGPVDTARLLPLTYVVGGLLLAMALVLIVADLVNPVRVLG